MENRTSGFRKLATILGIGGVMAVLAPVGVMAAGNLTTITDGKNNKQAQVKAGALQVGGSVNVAQPGTPTRILAKGDCASDADEHPDNAVVKAGRTVVGVTLGGDHGQSSITTLTVAAPSSQNAGNRLFTLKIGISQGYADFNNEVDFGPGILLDEDWTLSCTGQPGSTQGDGLWMVYGY